jgi:hypothetical protein
MAWSDNPPWKVRQDQRAELMRRIAAVTRAYESQDLAFDKAKDQIEELLNGDASRIVRVGNRAHEPEIQS